MTGIPDTLDYAMANEAEPRECVTLRCTRSPTPHQAAYLINNKQPLQVVVNVFHIMVPSYPCNRK